MSYVPLAGCDLAAPEVGAIAATIIRDAAKIRNKAITRKGAFHSFVILAPCNMVNCRLKAPMRSRDLLGSQAPPGRACPRCRWPPWKRDGVSRGLRRSRSALAGTPGTSTGNAVGPGIHLAKTGNHGPGYAGIILLDISPRPVAVCFSPFFPIPHNNLPFRPFRQLYQKSGQAPIKSNSTAGRLQSDAILRETDACQATCTLDSRLRGKDGRCS